MTTTTVRSLCFLTILALTSPAEAMFFRNKTKETERKCATILAGADSLAARPRSLGEQVALKAAQDQTQKEYAELFALEVRGDPKQDFVEKTFIPALRLMVLYDDREALRAQLIEHVQNLPKVKKERRRNEALKHLEHQAFSDNMLSVAKFQPDETLEITKRLFQQRHNPGVVALASFMVDETTPRKIEDYNRLFSGLVYSFSFTSSTDDDMRLVRAVQYRAIYRLLRERSDFRVFRAAARFFSQFEEFSYDKASARAAIGTRARILANSILDLGARMNDVSESERLDARKELDEMFAVVAVKLISPRLYRTQGFTYGLSDAMTGFMRRFFKNGLQREDVRLLSQLVFELPNFNTLIEHQLPVFPVEAPLDRDATSHFLPYLILNPERFFRDEPNKAGAKWVFELLRKDGAMEVLDDPKVKSRLDGCVEFRREIEALL